LSDMAHGSCSRSFALAMSEMSFINLSTERCTLGGSLVSNLGLFEGALISPSRHSGDMSNRSRSSGDDGGKVGGDFGRSTPFNMVPKLSADNAKPHARPALG